MKIFGATTTDGTQEGVKTKMSENAIAHWTAPFIGGRVEIPRLLFLGENMFVNCVTCILGGAGCLFLRLHFVFAWPVSGFAASENTVHLI